jgi:hypothetical protein
MDVQNQANVFACHYYTLSASKAIALRQFIA